MSRRILAILILTAALAVPAGASAGDKTLLSGYGGPGGGEQSSLGGGLLPAARGNGSLRASTPRGAAAVTTSGTATAPGSGGPATGSTQDGATGTGRPDAGEAAAAATKASGGKRGRKGDDREAAGGTREPERGTTGPAGSADAAGSDSAAAVQPVSYPEGDTAGTLPVGGSDALLLLFGLLALALVGAATWGLARRPDPVELGSDPS